MYVLKIMKQMKMKFERIQMLAVLSEVFWFFSRCAMTMVRGVHTSGGEHWDPSCILPCYSSEWTALRHGGLGEWVRAGVVIRLKQTEKALLKGGEAQGTCCFSMEPLGRAQSQGGRAYMQTWKIRGGSNKCKPGNLAPPWLLGEWLCGEICWSLLYCDTKISSCMSNLLFF